MFGWQISSFSGALISKSDRRTQGRNVCSGPSSVFNSIESTAGPLPRVSQLRVPWADDPCAEKLHLDAHSQIQSPQQGAPQD